MQRLKPNIIFYRSYKKFDEKSFIEHLQNKNKNISISCNDPNVNYKSITENFLETTHKHAPLKKKFIRGNQAPFMNKDFQKAIYTRTKPKSKYWRDPSREKSMCVNKAKKYNKLLK